MRRMLMVTASVTLLGLTACDRSPPTSPDVPAAKAAAATTTPSADAELDQLKTVTPVDACALLTPEKLAAVFQNLKFEVHQKLDPQMSGYVWDSRCVYWAGVGTYDFAKDAPTHTVDIFIATSVSEAKAKANLASRHEMATTTSGYQAQAALGEHAYTTTNTGMASLFFVKGQSEVQINVSNLKSPNDEKVKQVLAIAQSL
ncbi:MAG: hypothetical protein E6Q88_05985 [Lysobacteraceae bacterium]|nr:MAG: hypothetical protein E6Q88_05985 [Xanthomonadaceae bacterium]